ncbi:MAG TPA: hypothetical protein VMR02_14830 [Terracidiphilus sp.]|jgi:hypothetical protein|nr:hypothetical protein [Terracidiphilus sp.]
MRDSMIGFNRNYSTATILAAACMLWIGSTQVLQAHASGIVAEQSMDERSCSDASVAGDWAYTETGTVIPATGAVPFAAVASYTLDPKGNLIGTATSSSGGTVSNVTLEGSGTVNSDCTGTLSVGVYASGSLVRTANFDLVYVNDSGAARAIVTSLVLANGTSVPAVLTVDAQKLFHGLRSRP